jgi:hypothetical protein
MSIGKFFSVAMRSEGHFDMKLLGFGRSPPMNMRRKPLTPTLSPLGGKREAEARAR